MIGIFKHNLYILAAMIGILLFTPFAYGAEPEPSTYVLGEPDRGDWGYPSPFTFYQRGPGYVRMSMIFDSLTWKDDKHIIPWLALSWSYDEASMTYTVDLRNNVYWQDGKPFTASDVVFTFQYFQKHPNPFFDVQDIEKVEAQGPNRVTFRLVHPYAPFVEHLLGSIPVIPRHIWQDIPEPYKFTEPQALIGTGPYILKTYAREHGYYEFTANAKFWGGHPFIKTLIFKKVGDPHMAALKGEVDQVQIKPEAISMLTTKNIKIFHTPHVWNAKLMINHRKPPMDQKEFRHALAYALNLDELAERGLRGYGAPASPGLIPPGNPWYNPDVPRYPHDLNKVKEIMTYLGYAMNEGVWSRDGQPLKLTVLTWKQFDRLAEIVNQQFRKAGFAFDFQGLSQPTVDAKVRAWDFDLAFSGHGGLGEDPAMFVNFVKSDYHNSARFSHPELDRLIEDQLREMDSMKRKKIVDRIQILYADLLPAISLYYPTNYYADSGKIPVFFTLGGIGRGVPMFQNKISFITGTLP